MSAVVPELATQGTEALSSNEKGQHSRWPKKPRFLLRYLAQVSLIIFRLVTRRSRYSSFWEAFSTSPSFFSFFASAFDSPLAVPVTVTLWPRWSSSLTVLLRRPHTLPSSPAMENSPASSPFCKHPVTVIVPLAGFSVCFSCAFVFAVSWVAG